jgi:hypothetical protein
MVPVIGKEFPDLTSEIFPLSPMPRQSIHNSPLKITGMGRNH